MMKMTYVFMFITNGGLLIGLKWILLLYNLSAEAYWYALILVLIQRLMWDDYYGRYPLHCQMLCVQPTMYARR